MTNANNNAAPDSSQAEAGGSKNEPPPPPVPLSPALHAGSKVYKSGPLFLSSKGIGWTSWKKRWFILTQTSLVFYRSDPNVVPQRSNEANLTLGGIDLNSSGSVVVKEDKKLITVSFPDGRDGRSFTLKAETMEDLHEWKAALEEALSNAPNAALVSGQNGTFKNDQSNGTDASSDQTKDRQTAKSLVIGRPILLALEDIDGTPSFLEKALRFLEGPGVKTEGILRQAADVEHVERRIQEYEKGKTEFSADEDAHVIADCIKYVLRELPSSPVPASCCKALVEACRTERSMRVGAMRSAICETFPEPNRRLLQRILMMMKTVASHKAVNRMSNSAVAACMAPLLLRPLLAGECELDNDFNVGPDGSLQLLQAAAAANHAQAIAITLLEEYDNIFGDGASTHEPYTDSDEDESEEITDDDESLDEDDMTESDVDYDDDEEEEEDIEHESNSDAAENKHTKKVGASDVSGSKSPSRGDDVAEVRHEDTGDANTHESDQDELSHGRARRPAVWGRAPGKKNLSMESIDLPVDDEDAIQKLESIKTELQTRISDEAASNSHMQVNLEAKKHEYHELRLSLEKEVAGLTQQVQKEMELKKALEAALRISQLPLSFSPLIDDAVKEEREVVVQAEANVTNLKEKAEDLECQLRQERDQNCKIGQDISNQLNQNAKSKNKLMDGGRSSESMPRSKSGKDRDKKRESSSSLNIPLPHNQQGDASQIPKSTTRSGSKKSSNKGEGSNGLSKLTNRLNFLKDKRPQSEVHEQGGDSEYRHQGKSSQHVDKGRKREVSPKMERGKSESFPTGEKGNSKFPPRTFSR